MNLFKPVLSEYNASPSLLANKSNGAGVSAKGAIQESRLATPTFLSRIFTVPKKNGKLRPVIDLRSLNSHLVHRHFKMEGLATVPASGRICVGDTSTLLNWVIDSGATHHMTFNKHQLSNNLAAMLASGQSAGGTGAHGSDCGLGNGFHEDGV